MQFTQDFLNRLIAKSDIVDIVSRYVTVIKKGKSYTALCPFHQDTNPSLSISSDKQIFKCFVCGTGGSAIHFIQEFEKIPFPHAVKKLAEYVGFEDPLLVTDVVSESERQLIPLYKCLEDTILYYQFALASEQGYAARAYLVKRGLNDDTIQFFRLGFAPDDGKTLIPYLIKKGHTRTVIESLGLQSSSNPDVDRLFGRIIFPITNPNGQVIGFSGRLLVDKDGQAKYVNSSESPLFNKSQLLFNYSNVKLVAKKAQSIYVLEGFMDVIALHQADIPNAVALMGTAFTSYHLQLLKRLNVECRIALDPDEAGLKAMLKMIPNLNKAAIPFRFVYDPSQDKDTDEIMLEEGKEGLLRYLNQLVTKMDFTLQYYQQHLRLESTESKIQFINAMLPYLYDVPDLEQSDYIKRLADITGFPTKRLELELQKKKPSQSSEQTLYPKLRPEKSVISKLKRAEKAMLFNMLINPEAVEFYKTNIPAFTDKLYRDIASFLIPLVHESPPALTDLIHAISASSHEHAMQLIDELTSVSEDPTQPKGNDISFKEWLHTMELEKKRLRQEKQIEVGRIGKSPGDQARLIQQFKKTQEEGKPYGNQQESSERSEGDNHEDTNDES